VISVVPVLIPVTSPVLLIVATAGSPLIHTPPASELVNVVVVPEHILAMPLIADGTGFTLITTDLEQPVDTV
jgi:hypothetical protein